MPPTTWPDLLAAADAHLAPGASDGAIRTLERSLNCAFPSDYRDFLQHADGGTLARGRVVLYSVADAEFDDEMLRVANLSRPTEFPILAIGHDEHDDFGFRKVDLSRPAPAVYFVDDDTGEVRFAAPSLADFIREVGRQVAEETRKRSRPWWRRLLGG